jgi:hypothetical protein
MTYILARRAVLLTVATTLLQVPSVASAQSVADRLQSPCSWAPWRCPQPRPAPPPPQNVTFLPEKVAVGLTFGPSTNWHTKHRGLDRAAVVEIPIKANEWSAVRLRMDVGTTKWRFDEYFVPRESGYLPIDTVRLTRVNFTVMRALRPGRGFRISLYRGLGMGRYYYSFRHATPSRAKTLGVHGIAGIEYITRRRLVVGGEFQVLAAGTASTTPYLFTGSSYTKLMLTMQASIGVKVRL